MRCIQITVFFLFILILLSSGLLAQPKIISFSPLAAATGTTVTIKGSNFFGNIFVEFGNVYAPSFKVIDSNTIEAQVGAGASGNVIVTNQYGLSFVKGFTYIFTPPPVITMFSPAKGAPGTIVTISGANFNPVADSNIVFFGGAGAKVSAATSTSLTVVVPSGATYQPVSVTTNNLTGYSNKPFILTFAGGGALTPNSFALKMDLITGFSYRVSIADLDGDGKNDLVSTIANNKISIFRNNGSSPAISMEEKIDLPVAGQPVGLAVGDLDGDGRPDLVTTNNSTDDGGTIATMRNISTSGRISFMPNVYHFTGYNRYTEPENATIADLNGDGRPEVIVTNAGANNLRIFTNYSVKDTIILTESLFLNTDYSSENICTGDLNGDGKLDIVTANSNRNTISIFTNTSSGNVMSFAKRIDFPAEPGAFGVSISDLDEDGKPDLAVASRGPAYISVYRNTTSDSTITLSDKIKYKIGETGAWISIGDLDGDGKPDLVGGDSYYQNLGLLRNTSSPGNLSFDLNVPLPNGLSFCIALGDLNGDGIPEIVTATGEGGSVSIWKNGIPAPHLGSFSPGFGGPGNIITITGTNFINASEVTFGGIPAASFTIVSPNSITATLAAGASGNISVTTPNGTGTIAGFRYAHAPIIYSFNPATGPVGTNITIPGANFSSVPSNNTVYFGSVKGTVLQSTGNLLSVTVPSGANLSPISVTTDKMTGYSNLGFDITFPGSPAAFLPTSFARIELPTATKPCQLTGADMDGDGKAELIVPAYDASLISVYRNTGSPGKTSFADPLNLTTPFSPFICKAVDLDGDGKLDIVVGGSKLSIFKNISSGGNLLFGSRIDFPLIGIPPVLAVGDFNADGKPDIVTAVDGVFHFLRNTSTGATLSFVQQTLDYVSSIPKGIAACDLDGDGRPEIILTDSYSYNNIVSIFPNRSSDTNIAFATQLDYPAGNRPFEVVSTADLDQDGKPDISLVNFNGSTVSVLKNTTQNDISFRTQDQFPVNGNPLNLSVADLDGDGKPDITVAHNYFGHAVNTIALLKNKSDTTIAFAPKVSYTTGNGTTILYIPDGGSDGMWTGDLDGDGKPEITVSNYSYNSISIYRNKVNEPNVIPSGSNPINGSVTSRITFDSVVQVQNGVPYVQRHYDIDPETNGSTATATITLYFSQTDFNNFNTYPAHGSDLPKNPSDSVGKSNLRIFQYHGFSTTSLPGSYSGTNLEINPDDQKIVWNASAQWWEVTFDVNGFSGFFAGSVGRSVLPVQLLSFKADIIDSRTFLTWSTTQEQNLGYYDVQRSTDGINFATIGKVTAIGSRQSTLTYRYTDDLGTAPVYYYRLLPTDRDGNFKISQVLSVVPARSNSSFVIYPNPIKDYVTVVNPTPGHAAQFKLLDLTGRTIRLIRMDANSTQIKVSVKGLSAGQYIAVWTDGTRSLNQKCMIQ